MRQAVEEMSVRGLQKLHQSLILVSTTDHLAVMLRGHVVSQGHRHEFSLASMCGRRPVMEGLSEGLGR